MTDRGIGWFMVLLCGAGLIKRLEILSRNMTGDNMAAAVFLFLIVVYFAVQIYRNPPNE